MRNQTNHGSATPAHRTQRSHRFPLCQRLSLIVSARQRIAHFVRSRTFNANTSFTQGASHWKYTAGNFRRRWTASAGCQSSLQVHYRIKPQGGKTPPPVRSLRLFVRFQTAQFSVPFTPPTCSPSTTSTLRCVIVHALQT